MIKHDIDRRHFLTETFASGVAVTGLSFASGASARRPSGQPIIGLTEPLKASGAIAEYWRLKWRGRTGSWSTGRAVCLRLRLFQFAVHHDLAFGRYPSPVEMFAGSVYFLTPVFFEKKWSGTGCDCRHCFPFSKRQIAEAAYTYFNDTTDRLQAIRGLVLGIQYQTDPRAYVRRRRDAHQHCGLAHSCRTPFGKSPNWLRQPYGSSTWFERTLQTDGEIDNWMELFGPSALGVVS